MLRLKFVKIIRTFSLKIIVLFLSKHCTYYKSTQINIQPKERTLESRINGGSVISRGGGAPDPEKLLSGEV